MRYIAALLLLIVFPSLYGQAQVDFRGLAAANIEKIITPSLSATFMGAAIQTYDFKETGFFWADAGLKMSLTRHITLRGVYRLMYRRNLANFYDRRQVLFADLAWSRTRRSWTLGAGVRLQSFFYNHIVEGYRPPSVYGRYRASLRYKIDYYWQPFSEIELFVPANNPSRSGPDQFRILLGISRTINQNFKIQLYEQWQQQVFRGANNTNFLTALGWSIRF
jgi:hypothetical protein